jgi:hypothetical protein
MDRKVRYIGGTEGNYADLTDPTSKTIINKALTCNMLTISSSKSPQYYL